MNFADSFSVGKMNIGSSLTKSTSFQNGLSMCALEIYQACQKSVFTSVF